ncbi:MAG: hypothetical protein KTR13_05610 [Saprospiraceae bacterium]|nr:hypothetical protein [Saprospiraceae bacterium]
MTKFTLLFSILILVACNQKSDYKDLDYQELFNSAKEEADNGNHSKAIGLLNKALTLKPDFDSAYVERAYNYLQIQKPETALEDVNKAMEIEYDNISAHYTRGLINSYMYDFYEAVEDYTHVISLEDPNYMNDALRERAYIYYDTNEMDKAINDLSVIIESDSLSYETYVSRGVAKSRNDVSKKYSDSILLMTNDTALRNDFLKYFNIVHSSRGSIMYDTRGAIRDFDKALTIKPDYDFAYYNRAKVFQDLNFLDEALRDINKAIELNEDSDYYLSRASIYQSLNKTEESLNDFNTSIELNPKNGVAYLNRGYLKSYKLNDKRGAQKDFKMAEKLGVKTD